MTRSSGLPRSRAIVGHTRVIRSRTQPVTVERVTETTGSLDEITTTTTGHTESLWLYEPRESVADEIAGERLDGGLGGLAIADGNVDIEHGDQVTYGGVVYEVDTIVGHPVDGETGNSPDTKFWVLNFQRRQS